MDDLTEDQLSGMELAPSLAFTLYVLENMLDCLSDHTMVPTSDLNSATEEASLAIKTLRDTAVHGSWSMLGDDYMRNMHVGVCGKMAMNWAPILDHAKTDDRNTEHFPVIVAFVATVLMILSACIARKPEANSKIVEAVNNFAARGPKDSDSVKSACQMALEALKPFKNATDSIPDDIFGKIPRW